MIFPLLIAIVLPAADCRPINADHIYARDLAAAVPLFSSLPSDLVIGYSPAPGWQRTFHAAELQRLAKANHLDGSVSQDVCFAWPLAVPKPDAVVAVMKKALAPRDVRIEMVDQDRAATPAGELVFPLAGASVRSAAPVVWRGYILYAGNHRFTTWAKVLISVKGTRVVAAHPLNAEEAIQAADIRVEPYEGPLLSTATLTDAQAAIGKLPLRPIAAGDPLLDNFLEPAKDVARGDTVEVEVRGDGTLIRTAGIAEQSGNRGATIIVRNATSGRKFRARVEDKDKVSVVPGVAAGLIAKDEKS
jgi:flagella basal body P-ring formation protein FlgA